MMKMRKEQILLLAAIGLAFWIWSSGGDTSPRTRLRPGDKALPESADSGSVIAAARLDAMTTGRDMFRIPSESSALPPRGLAMPALSPVPPLRPPLWPGQAAAAYDQLRWPEAPQEAFEFVAEDSGQAAGVVGRDGPADASTGAQTNADLAQLYDRITIENNTSFWGYVQNVDKQRLARSPTAVLTTAINFTWISIKSGKPALGGPDLHDPGHVIRLELARTLQNEIEGEIYELPEGVGSRNQRIKLIKKLLVVARAESWVFEHADELAQTLVGMSPESEEAHLWQLRVIRSRGNLARELTYLQGLPAALRDMSPQFLHREMGNLKARIGLWEDAEVDLRLAVELRPTDAMSLGSLARFLLDRGRYQEAVPVCKLAGRESLRLSALDERYPIAALEVEGLLALGEIPAAESVFARLKPVPGRGDHAFLQGAIAYAKGDLTSARTAFRRSLENENSQRSRFGLGLCHLVSGEWQQAHGVLQEVAEKDPTLRHAALCALALLFERTGHKGKALENAEAARLANPRDPYVLYMLGRQRRLNDDHAGAVQALQTALGLEDEFADACAEIAVALYRQSLEADESLDAAVLANAARYADRLVELDTRVSFLPYVELQGALHLHLDDLAIAKQAFTDASGRGSWYAQLGLALIDYRQNRSAAARTALANMSTDVVQSEDVRSLARQLVAQIDDHAGKEQVWDRFERSDLGSLWPGSRASNVRLRLVDGALVLRGQPRDEVFARRSLSRSGNFLSVAVDLKVDPGHQSRFTGLRLSTGRDNRPDFVLMLGVGRRSPQVLIVDGPPKNGELPPDPILFDQNFDRSVAHNLMVEMESGDSTSGNKLALVISWDGEVVHRVEVNRLRPKGTMPLRIDLMSEAGAIVEASFDDFHLVRRKEN